MNEKQKVSKQQLIDREVAIFAVFCTGTPDPEWIRDQRWDKLQDWVCDNLRPEFTYATGLSVMEAATSIAESQIENGLEEKG